MSTTQTKKNKGKQLEDYIADQIIAKELGNASRSVGSGSGTREKADINTSLAIYGRNLGIEAKNWKKASVQDWFKQAQKLEKLGREPVVAYKLFREPYEETKVVIYLDTFLDLVKSYYQLTNKLDDIRSEIQEVNHYDKVSGENKIKYGIEQIKQGIKLMKKL